MKFLVSYKVVKRCIQTDKIVENIDSLVLDTRSTPEHPIEFKNVVDEKVGGRKDRFIDDRIREHYLDMYIDYCIKFSSEMRKMEVLNECGSIMKKHVYKVYGKNEEVGYSNIMALVDYVCNWSPSYL